MSDMTLKDVFGEWLDNNGDKVITNHCNVEETVEQHISDYLRDQIGDAEIRRGVVTSVTNAIEEEFDLDLLVKDAINYHADKRLEAVCTQANINEVIRACLKDNIVLIHPDPMQESAMRDLQEQIQSLQYRIDSSAAREDNRSENTFAVIIFLFVVNVLLSGFVYLMVAN